MLKLSYFALVALVVPFAGYGQTISGSIAGTVVDQQQASVRGAAVSVVDENKNLTFSAATTESGGFVLAQLPPGTYTITVTAPGFKKLERKGVMLNANDKLDIGNLAMAVGAVSESIEVNAEMVVLKTESAERSEALVSKQIENIAVNGRSPLDMAKLAPGVVSTGNFQVASWSGIGTISANGSRPNQNLITVNGISAVDPGANSTQNVTLNLDAVQEFKILTGVYQAEYGRSAGAQISMVTKSGTSDFHGSAYWYDRNEAFNANNWLNNRQGVRRSLYRFNDPGYTVGGPIYIPKVFNTEKNKLFFFWAEEFQRQVQPNAVKFVTVPTALERQGDFSKTVDASGKPFPYIKDPLSSLPCNATNAGGCFAADGVLGRIPATRLYQPGMALLNLFPLPNASGNIGFNYQSANSDPNPRREDLLRVDYNFSSKLRIFGHWIRNTNPVTSVYGRGPGITENVPLTNIVQNLPAWGPALGATYIISPTTTNEFNIGATHHSQLIYQVGNTLTRVKSGVTLPVLTPSAIQGDYIPAVTFGGSRLANTPSITSGDSVWGENDTAIDITDNFSKVLSGHLLKAGVYVERNGKNQYSFGNNNGSYNFGDNSSNPFDSGYGFANAAIGVYNQFTQANAYVRGLYRYTNAEFYVQDTWKVTPHLTLDYGMRVPWYQPWYDSSLLASTFVPSKWTATNAPRLYQPALVNGQRVAQDPATGQTLPATDIGYIVPGTGSITNGILQAGKGISKYMGKGPSIGWGPRLGIAYSIKERMVIRAGAGIFYDRIQGNRVFNQVTNPPASVNSQLNFGFAQDIGTSGALLGPPALFAVDPTAKLPTITNYTLGVQSRLFSGFVLDTAYVGSVSRHLQDNRNINAVPYGAVFQAQNQDPTLLATQPNALLGQNALSANFLRPYRGFSDIVLYEGAATANYNALQATLNRRFSKGLFLGLSYTWSHNLTTASLDTIYARIDQYERLANYGNSTYDRRQLFRGNFVYETPRFVNSSRILHSVVDGWQLSGVVTFSAGVPYTPCFNVSGVGNCNIALTGVPILLGAGTPLLTGSYTEAARIAIVPGCNPNTGSSGPYNRLNAACFAAPLPGSLGLESGQNFLVAPGLNNFDLSMQKVFAIKERLRIELRLDAFNAFNHPQFNGINNTLNFSALPNLQPTNLPYDGSGQLVNVNGFGTVSSVADPRILQTMIRIRF